MKTPRQATEDFYYDLLSQDSILSGLLGSGKVWVDKLGYRATIPCVMIQIPSSADTDTQGVIGLSEPQMSVEAMSVGVGKEVAKNIFNRANYLLDNVAYNDEEYDYRANRVRETNRNRNQDGEWTNYVGAMYNVSVQPRS